MKIIRSSLKKVLDSQSNLITSSGIVLSFRDESIDGSYSVNMDTQEYVGSVVYWPEAHFEFQFNSCSSGKVIFLETKQFQTESKLSEFIENLLSKELS